MSVHQTSGTNWAKWIVIGILVVVVAILLFYVAIIGFLAGIVSMLFSFANDQVGALSPEAVEFFQYLVMMT